MKKIINFIVINILIITCSYCQLSVTEKPISFSHEVPMVNSVKILLSLDMNSINAEDSINAN